MIFIESVKADLTKSGKTTAQGLGPRVAVPNNMYFNQSLQLPTNFTLQFQMEERREREMKKHIKY